MYCVLLCVIVEDIRHKDPIPFAIGWESLFANHWTQVMMNLQGQRSYLRRSVPNPRALGYNTCQFVLTGELGQGWNSYDTIMHFWHLWYLPLGRLWNKTWYSARPHLPPHKPTSSVLSLRHESNAVMLLFRMPAPYSPATSNFLAAVSDGQTLDHRAGALRSIAALDNSTSWQKALQHRKSLWHGLARFPLIWRATDECVIELPRNQKPITQDWWGQSNPRNCEKTYWR